MDQLHLKSVGKRANDWRGRETMDVVGVESMLMCDAIIRKKEKKKNMISTITMIVISTMYSREVDDCIV